MTRADFEIFSIKVRPFNMESIGTTTKKQRFNSLFQTTSVKKTNLSFIFMVKRMSIKFRFMTRIVSEKSYCKVCISMGYLSYDRFERGKHTEKHVFQVTVYLDIIYTHLLYTNILPHTCTNLILLEYYALTIVVSPLSHCRPYLNDTTFLIMATRSSVTEPTAINEKQNRTLQN